MATPVILGRGVLTDTKLPIFTAMAALKADLWLYNESGGTVTVDLFVNRAPSGELKIARIEDVEANYKAGVEDIVFQAGDVLLANADTGSALVWELTGEIDL
jgi:hypothetical protein